MPGGSILEETIFDNLVDDWDNGEDDLIDFVDIESGLLGK